MSESIWFLKRCPLFEHLAADECRRLEARSLARTFTRRSIIYFPGEPGEAVLLLTGGRVKIMALKPDGRETILTFVEPGELFGELALLDAGVRGEFAEAVEDTTVLAIPREELLWLMERRADIALRVTKLLGFRLRRVENRLKNVLFRSNRERIVSILLELLESHGSLACGRWEIRLRLSHQELANLIGSTRESVTVTLGQLQRDGLIAVARRRITVLDRDRLTAESTGESETDRASRQPPRKKVKP